MKSWVEGLDKHLIARINAILASGQFIEPLKEAAIDEEVLGEMSAVEKAVYSAGRQIIDEVQPKADAKTNEMPIITPKQLAMFQIGCHHFDILKKTIQELLYDRLNLPLTARLGFRRGFKIVKSRCPNPTKGEKQ
ncbi:MAG: hypothetical protein AAB568_03415 [Patescibacteria group bacterium]